MEPPLVLVAASGLARETAEAARAAGREVLGCVDDDELLWGSAVGRLPVLGGLDVLRECPEAEIVLCTGSGSSRQRLAVRVADAGVTTDRYATVRHPSVDVPDSCLLGPGVVLLAGVVLTASVTVGAHVVCMPGVVLTHDDVIEDAATLAAGVLLAGGVRVGQRAYLGMGATVREGVSVGADAVLGMGSVLLSNLPDGQTWAGVPARRLRPEASQLLG